MKRFIIYVCILLSIIGLFLVFQVRYQRDSKIVSIQIDIESLKGNCLNESSLRNVDIYLPAGYDASEERYPCIYFLHGFRGNEHIFDFEGFKNELDQAIANKEIPPIVVVSPNSSTQFGGSFYTNSEVAGKWADYIAIDLVQYIDKHYRTIVDRNKRFISGHSMGGNGALKIAMQYPQVFSAVYAFSPSILYWSGELQMSHPAFRKIAEAKQLSDLKNDLYACGFLAMGSTYSADRNQAPFYCRMPMQLINQLMQADSGVFKKWELEFPLNMVETHIEALQSLRGIGFDWGKQDEFEHLPITCEGLDKKLSLFNIKHKAEAYEGHHSDCLTGKNSRLRKGLLPFFAQFIN